MIARLSQDGDPRQLFADETVVGPLWAVLDCARDDSLYPEIVALGTDAVCLFMGVPQTVVEVSPHLVRLRPGSRLIRRWASEGWGVDAAWGLLFRSTENIETLRRHFRTVMNAEMPDGRQVIYRFWDPRVE